MRLLVVVCVVGFALLPAPAHADDAFPVSATAYTCEDVPHNPMMAPGMCQALANGSRDVFSKGIACPRAWMGQAYDVPGYGVLVCDDTGAHDVWNGLPHIDIRVATFALAWEWGTRTITITPVEVSYGVSNPQPPVRRACPPDAPRCHDDPTAHWQGVTHAGTALVSPVRPRPVPVGLLPRLEREYPDGR